MAEVDLSSNIEALMELLRTGTSFQSLDLSETMLNDAGAYRIFECLQRCPDSAIQDLSLKQNSIGFESAAALSRCSMLRSVDVSENHIADQGALLLVGMFSGNLCDLNLCDNRISSNGLVEVLNFFAKENTLENLNPGAEEELKSWTASNVVVIDLSDNDHLEGCAFDSLVSMMESHEDDIRITLNELAGIGQYSFEKICNALLSNDSSATITIPVSGVDVTVRRDSRGLSMNGFQLSSKLGQSSAAGQKQEPSAAQANMPAPNNSIFGKDSEATKTIGRRQEVNSFTEKIIGSSTIS